MTTPVFPLTLPVETASGTFVAHYSAAGLCGLDFPALDQGARAPNVAEIPGRVQHWHAKTTRALQASLAGRAPKALPPIDLSAGTEFQQKVWRALLEIPPGQVKSYAEIATAVGKPNGARAVGMACGANPVPVFVPCHRVLAAGGGLGGFSGGLDWKRRLLGIEGIRT